MTLPTTALEALTAAFGDRLLFNEPLARHNSARIGGPADVFLTARSLDDLRRAAALAWVHQMPFKLLGGGSNILISDRGIRGLVIHNQTSEMRVDGTTVTADSGVGTITLARRCIDEGLSGFEWAIGIPGTLGGAVYGNAGAHGGDMAGSLIEVQVMTPIGEAAMTRDDLAFQYRSSILKREGLPFVILSVKLGLVPDDPAAIRSLAEEYNAARKRTQPPGATLGSMFKNPPGDYAGRLIEAAGLKGTQIGGAQISDKHANFFLNTGNATAADIKALIDLARERVMVQFGVELELEIELVGEWSSEEQ